MAGTSVTMHLLIIYYRFKFAEDCGRLRKPKFVHLVEKIGDSSRNFLVLEINHVLTFVSFSWKKNHVPTFVSFSCKKN